MTILHGIQKMHNAGFSNSVIHFLKEYDKNTDKQGL